ncbi:unnamed protein product, partial [Effrenium voratum]
MQGDMNMSDPEIAGVGEVKTKVKKLKVPLDMVESFTGIWPRPLSAEERTQARGRLLAMVEADSEILKANAVKNQLESYIYESRDKVTDENALMVSTEEQRNDVFEKLQAMEDWMWEEEAQTANATMLQKKLAVLEDQVRPILRRVWEMEQRALLPDIVDKIRNGFNSTLEYVISNMTWVPEKEAADVKALMQSFDSWYANVTDSQSSL